MRTGKLAISRGNRAGEAPPPTPRLVLMPRAPARPEPKRATSSLAAAAPGPASQEYLVAHERLSALERLAKLHKQGALTPEEFAFEKALILNRAAEEPVLESAAPLVAAPPSVAAAPSRGPSLLGRMLSWKSVPVGMAAGLGLSFFSQPRETQRFFEDSLRLLGF